MMSTGSILLDSPIGALRIAASRRAITAVGFDGKGDAVTVNDDATHSLLEAAKRQLDEYFAGKRERFDLPLEPDGTEFQRSVWNALLEIPFGVTCSYSDIAKRLGNPKGLRAVGAANGQNPIPIIIPCHRVIGRDGSMTGFGGGLERKRWLLTLEGVLLNA
jgi:methylated-DNA-[protein]-cysteine S-methyltransferase